MISLHFYKMGRAAAESRSRSNRIATLNAAMPRTRHFHSGGTKVIRARDCQSKPFSGGSKGGILFCERFDPCSAAGATIPLAPNGRDLIPPNQFGDRISKNPKSFLFDFFALQGL